MKIKTTIAVLAASMIAVSSFGQGEMVFANTPSKAVLDSETSAAVARDVAVAGLYYITDLGAVPSVMPPLDDWALAAPATPISAGIFAGVYNAGTIALADPNYPTAAEQLVLVQVRAWSAAYDTYEAAWASGDPTTKVGASNVMQISLGGGAVPPPSISGIVEGFTLTLIPEPSTIVLGLLGGLGAMLLLRRRK